MIRSFARRVVRGLARRILWRRRHAAPNGVRQPAAAPANLEIDGPRLAKWLAEGHVQLLDVREPNELYAGHAEGALLIPMNQVANRLVEIPRDVRLVVYCAAGARSNGVTELLRQHGFFNAWSLAGGFGAYVAAGGPNVRPPTSAKFPIAGRVMLDGEGATVQHIDETPAGMVYVVRTLADGRAIPRSARTACPAGEAGGPSPWVQNRISQ